MFLRKLAVFALLSPVLTHHLSTSDKHREDNRNVNIGSTCRNALTSSSIASYSSVASDETSSASPTANNNTILPTRSIGATESSVSAFFFQGSSTETHESPTASSTTTAAGAGVTAQIAENTFYSLSDWYFGTRYSLAIQKDKGILSRKLIMNISDNYDSSQYWQIKRIPDTDDRYWLACRFLGRNVRLFLDSSDRINSLMAAANDAKAGQQWNVKSLEDSTLQISNVFLNWGIGDELGDWGPQLSTYSDTGELFMDTKNDTGTTWRFDKVRKITAADDFL